MLIKIPELEPLYTLPTWGLTSKIRSFINLILLFLKFFNFFCIKPGHGNILYWNKWQKI